MKRSDLRLLVVVLTAILSLLAAGCGDSSDAEGVGTASADGEQPTVVVTTNILGDVVENLVGDDVEVVVIMPVGADPHDFQASAQQVAQIGEASALIVNGADFEDGLLDVIESAVADGVPTFEAISATDTFEFAANAGHDDEHDEDHDDEHDEDHDDEHDEDHDDEHDDEDHDDEHDDEDHDDEHDEDHDDEDHDDEHDEDHDDEHDDEDHDEHNHEGTDPHFFTDPVRMANAVAGVSEFLSETVDGIDTAALASNTEAYIAELEALDAEISETIAAIPEAGRVLITNHDVFAYFAQRYGFEIVGTVIPSGSTADTSSAQAIAELAETIEAEQVPAIFADISSSDELVQTLAAEVGDVAIVELFSESLGDSDSDGATYLEMVRANATRIADALTG